jgi:lipoprotein NlpD
MVVSTTTVTQGPSAAAPKPAGNASPPPAVATAPATTAPPSKAPVAPAAGGGTGSVDGVPFGWPVAGGVLQTFDQTSQKGVSLGGKAGDTVRAAADGRVIFSGAGPRGYGNLVIVKHDKELLSVYAHNRSLAVKEGQDVKRGQKIAELGNSGTDAPQLHFEIRQQGKPIDPLAVLPKR